MSASDQQLVAQAAQEMVTRIVNTVYPLRVARVDGKTLYLNRGNDGSLKVGDRLAVYSQGEAITDQDTGEVLGNTEQEVAQAVVTAVEARFSKAELQNDASVQPGMLVKPRPAEAPAAVPVDVTAGPRW